MIYRAQDKNNTLPRLLVNGSVPSVLKRVGIEGNQLGRETIHLEQRKEPPDTRGD
jgi:hypothetical protein